MSTDATPQQRRYQLGFSDPAMLPEFQVIAAAMRRGTKRSTLRTLDIICSNNHQLAEVLGIGERAVLLVGEREAALLQELPERISEPFFPGGLPDDADFTVLVSCRCRRAAIPVVWIREQLAAGKKRVCVGPRTAPGLWS